MKKTLTTAEVRVITGNLLEGWEPNKKEIKLSAKSLYSLIALKKQLEQKLGVIEETLAALALQYGGETQENGSIVIPPDLIPEAQTAFIEMGNQELEIEYTEIILNETSVLPVALCEALFEFITFEG